MHRTIYDMRCGDWSSEGYSSDLFFSGRQTMRTIPPSQRQITSIGLPAFSERATTAFARPNAITVRVIAFTPLRATVGPAIFVKRTPLTVSPLLISTGVTVARNGFGR